MMSMYICICIINICIYGSNPKFSQAAETSVPTQFSINFLGFETNKNT